ncbi:MAG: CmcJ/NvfI family oxidoreductase [Gammaproteobacteria bacterium]|nr:CmcJ/NvfI family oxidoreductase [Gammaproteobacteria bacterium]
MYPDTECIQAEVKYLVEDDPPAVYIASTGGGDVTEHQGNYTLKPVAVHNARNRAGAFSLDREGFILVSQRTEVTDFYREEDITGTFYPEVQALVIRETGASRVEIFDHTRRSSSAAVQKAKRIREAASIVHNDYTARSGPNRLLDHFPGDPGQAEDLLARRFSIVNVWRSIHGTVQSAPIALCDATSTEAADLVPVERRAAERIGEIQLATCNANHRWYYFPEMGMDEALLFKTYDSLDDGRARFTLHTAIDDPLAPDGARPRESIETRCFVFY